ncbi:MAG: hypothetical protein NDI61_14140, partial [Bdellovibrionaceae bacterium]|nr:hypothetical protein [Pseudobdellovibrionaceae bacterium]
MTLSRMIQFALPLLLLACSGAQEIQLQTLAPAQQKTPQVQKPDETGAPTPSPQQPTPGHEGSASPIEKPIDQPTDPLTDQLTLLCEEATHPNHFALLPAQATERDRPATMLLTDARTGPIDVHTANIVDVRFPLPLSYNDRGEFEVLLSAQRFTLDMTQPPVQRIYIAALDILDRAGRVREMGRVVEPLPAARKIADRAGLRLRGFGASPDGAWLFLPDQQGYVILERATLRKIASLPVSPTTHFEPTLFADRVVTFLRFDTADQRLKIRAFRLTRTSSANMDVQEITVPVPAAGASQLGAVHWEKTQIAWLEAPIGKQGVIAQGARVALWDVSAGKSRPEAYAIRGGSVPARLFGRPARVVVGGLPHVLIARESLVPSRASGSTDGSAEKDVDLGRGELVLLDLSTSPTDKSAGVVSTFPYPASGTAIPA